MAKIPEPRLARPGAKKPKPKPKPGPLTIVHHTAPKAPKPNPGIPIPGATPTNPLAGLDLGALGQYVTPDLLTLISTLQQQSVSPYADIINRQAKAQADSIAGFSQAGANQMAALVPQVQQGYQGAEERSAAFAKGMQDGFGMIEGQSAQGANQLLAQNNSPQTVEGNAGGAGVIGGLGLIPATEFGREGAAFTAAAAAQPQQFLNNGMLSTRGVWADAQQQLQDLLAQSRGTTGDMLSQFINLGMQGQAQAAALKASGLDVAGKKLDLYSQRLQNALAVAKLTGVFKDPKTGKRYAIPQQAQDAPNVDVTLSREVGAWVDGSGIPIPYMQGVPPPKKTVPKTAKPKAVDYRGHLVSAAARLDLVKKPNPAYNPKFPSRMSRSGIEKTIEGKIPWGEAFKRLAATLPPKIRNKPEVKKMIRDALIAAGYVPPRPGVG